MSWIGALLLLAVLLLAVVDLYLRRFLEALLAVEFLIFLVVVAICGGLH